MSRIVLLLSCLAAFSLLCAAQKRKNGGGGSKKKKGNKNKNVDSEISADLRFDEDSGHDEATEEDQISTELMRSRVDDGERGLPSAANIDVYKTTRLEVDLEIDVKNIGTVARSFRLRGSVDIYYEKQDRASEESLILDSWGLKIKQAQVSYDGGVTFKRVQLVDHSLDNGPPKLELRVDPSENEGVLRIDYTAPNSDSLRYTSLRYISFSDLHSQPMLAIFNQPDMARTWVPCQDTALVKAPVDMRIDVPAPFTALTSGILLSKSHDMEGNRTTFDFYQPMPIAAQQLSLTMGVFERWNISQRITVWMEPGRMIRDGLLRETESMLKICEKMIGPFVWEHLNIVIIPDRMGYKGEMLGPNTIYLPVSMFKTTSSPIQDDSLRVQELARQMLYNWFGNLVTAPARMKNGGEGGRLMVAGIAEFLSYQVSARFLDDDRHLADFFFYRAREYAEKMDRDPGFKPIFKDMAKARKFAVKLREMQGKLGGSLGEGRLTKVLRLMVLFSVADEFSPDQFWETIDTLFPDLDINRNDSRVEVDGWLGRYWRECQEVIEAWEPSEGEPMVKAGQLNRLNYAQVAYILENMRGDGLRLSTVRKITSALKKNGIYEDTNMFYRLALSAIRRGEMDIVEQALEYIKNNEQSPGATALHELLSDADLNSAMKKKLKNIERKMEESSYVPWN